MRHRPGRDLGARRHLKTINSERMEFIDANGAAAAEKFKHAFEARCASPKPYLVLRPMRFAGEA